MNERSLLERTEPATPRRREELREKGRIAKSKEVSSFLILAFGFGFLFLFAEHVFSGFKNIFEHSIGLAGSSMLTNGEAISSLLYGVKMSGWILLPLLIVLPVLAAASYIIQTGMVISSTPIEPDLNKINPLEGIKRIFSFAGLVEFVKALIKLLLLSYLAYFILRRNIDNFVATSSQGMDFVLGSIKMLGYKIIIPILLTIFIMAVLDLVFQFWDFERNIRMTKQEIKEEIKEREGDPLIKARLRRMMRELTRVRMIERVKTADVVITNPDHVAVAISYKRDEMNAPRVVAKGRGFIALKIKEVARKNNVYILENPPLARFIFKEVDIDKEVPSKIYQAVAEILAFVYSKNPGKAKFIRVNS